jgi:hypothetical protein
LATIQNNYLHDGKQRVLFVIPGVPNESIATKTASPSVAMGQVKPPAGGASSLAHGFVRLRATARRHP